MNPGRGVTRFTELARIHGGFLHATVTRSRHTAKHLRRESAATMGGNLEPVTAA